MTKWSVTAAFVAAALLFTSVRGDQNQNSRSQRDEDYVAGEALVQFSPTLSAAEMNSTLNSRGMRSLRRFATLNIELVRIPPGQAMLIALGNLRGVRGVLRVQPNYIRRATGTTGLPNDPFWQDGTLWGLSKIQADLAWQNFTTGSESVVIANIDTGINYSHPDLGANAWRNPFEVAGNGIDDDNNGYVDDVYGIDTVNHDSNPFDDQGHGTHTSGTLAGVGNNNEGVAGINWNAKVLACKFLNVEGYGTDAGAIECFDYIVLMKNRGINIRVSSNSWGSQRGNGAPAVALQAAINAAGDAGILNVFGAGNDGTNNDLAPFDPASYDLPSIVSVASSGPTDRKSFFSNFGAASVDLAAPGEEIVSTTLGSGYVAASGTSMATPHVAGVAALLAGMDPSLTPDAIKLMLMDSVDQSSRWTGRVLSGGRLNAYKAAQAVGTNPNNDKPTVVLTAPAAGANFKAPVNITVEAEAADTDGSVKMVTFFANGAPIGSDTTSPFAVTWVNAPPGTYTLTAMAQDDRFATTTSAPVSIFVADNTPPSVGITSPVEGASFASPAEVTIEANAADSDGAVMKVEFIADGVSLGVDTVAPYGVTWKPAAGPHVLKAIVTDNVGGTTTSAPVNIVVTTIPGRINVARSTNGGVATVSSTLGPNYPASGAINGDRRGTNWGSGGGWNDGTQNAGPDWIEVAFTGQKLIEEVNVFSMQDTYTAPSDPTPTMTFTLFGLRGFEMQYWDGAAWAAVPDGVVTNNQLVWRKALFAPIVTSKIRIFITAAQNGYARVMEVEAWGVSAAANVAPAVSITNPAEGASFVAPAGMQVLVAATDEDGTVQQVDFFVDGVLSGSSLVAPYNFNWSSSVMGPHTLTAVATDNQGAARTSAPVHVTVVAANVPPAVAIASPAEGAAFTAPANITLTATAIDTDGSVVSVAYFANGTLVGTGTSQPFSVPWSGVAAGTYTITAVATDNIGAATTSPSLSVTVAPDPNRVNMALASNGGVASASSVLGPNYTASAVNNGDRRGLNWGAGGGWNDGTQNAGPDWIEIAFNGPKSIDEVNVFSMQDSYTSPVEPTAGMTFTLWGLRGFEVQYWTGSAWVVVPGGVITNNNLVWRQVLFAPIMTSRLRINVTAALNGYARAMEVEAWGTKGLSNTPPTVSLTSPADGAAFVAPVSITLNATASDSDGTIQQVAFMANDTPLATVTGSAFSFTWNNVPAGTYVLTAVATDDDGAITTSAPVTITVTAPARANVARASNGGVATASSTLGPNYPASSVINGDRRGLNWGAGGGWNDGTQNAGPDWVEVAFNGSKTIDEVSVFSMQDAYTSPVEPTATMTFTSFGLRAFQIQYWDGAAWVNIPGAAVITNNLVWRKFTFTPVTTTKIRVFITGALNGYARAVEVEAWGVPGGGL
jgi:hypothetical protein